MTRATFCLLLVSIVAGVFAACSHKDPEPAKTVPPTWTAARDTPGHNAHVGKMIAGVGGTRPIACTDCHSIEKEGFVSPGARPCTSCHEKQSKNTHAGSTEKPTSCLACHLFSGKPADASPGLDGCITCHAAPQGKLAALTHHADPKAKCSACHNVHATPKVALASCTSCHFGIGAKHGKWAVQAVDGDAGVHDAMPNESAAVCSACHAPHAAAKDAKSTCATCHVGANAGALATVAPKVKPGATLGIGHAACTTCHAPHDAQKSAVPSCVSCHAAREMKQPVATGHRACTSCHAPHAPSSPQQACASCHANHPALAAAKVTSHSNCASCHDVHAKKPASDACSKCHSKVHASHPLAHPGQLASGPGAKAFAATSTNGPACISCHAPHPSGGTSKAQACSSCHQKASKDTALHAGVACGSCHQKHAETLAPAKPQLCASCHAKPAEKVSKLAGHADCASCHGATHTPTKNVACSGCHATEAKTALKGHTACASCHEPHGGALYGSKALGMVSSQAFCTNCHSNKTSGHHATVKGGCASCHRPHGGGKGNLLGAASPPSCTSCHAASTLPGLHLSASHATCTNCHGGHKPTSSDRATCTTGCHQDKRNHQPEAATCKGCHVFRK